MKGPTEHIARLAATASAIIAAAAVETGEPRLGGFAQGLDSLSKRGRARLAQRSPTTLPVCRHFGDALAAATGEATALAGFLRALQPHLSWTQNPNYRRAPPAPGFLENYGYAVIAGPEGGAPALVRDPHLAFGVLLLGPRTEYPTHHHPAAELYVPLGRADWVKGGANEGSANEGSAEWMSRPPGSVIHHPPNVVHATRTHDIPLAALYLWAGDLATHARLAD